MGKRCVRCALGGTTKGWSYIHMVIPNVDHNIQIQITDVMHNSKIVQTQIPSITCIDFGMLKGCSGDFFKKIFVT